MILSNRLNVKPLKRGTVEMWDHRRKSFNRSTVESLDRSFWRIPKGFRNKAQGCEERATLGSGVQSMTTLKGLRPTAAEVQRGHNPVGVVKHQRPLPRVARPSQPWALLRNPFGILSNLIKTPLQWDINDMPGARPS